MHQHNLQCWQILFLLFFFDKYNLSMSSLVCKRSCIVTNSLALCSNCSSYSITHFKYGTKYLASATALAYISLLRFMPRDMVSRNVSVLLCYFFFIPLFDGICFQNFPVLAIFLYSKHPNSFSDLVVLFLPPVRSDYCFTGHWPNG